MKDIEALLIIKESIDLTNGRIEQTNEVTELLQKQINTILEATKTIANRVENLENEVFK